MSRRQPYAGLDTALGLVAGAFRLPFEASTWLDKKGDKMQGDYPNLATLMYVASFLAFCSAFVMTVAPGLLMVFWAAGAL